MRLRGFRMRGVMGDGKVEISFVVISVINSPNANLI